MIKSPFWQQLLSAATFCTANVVATYAVHNGLADIHQPGSTDCRCP